MMMMILWWLAAEMKAWPPAPQHSRHLPFLQRAALRLASSSSSSTSERSCCGLACFRRDMLSLQSDHLPVETGSLQEQRGRWNTLRARRLLLMCRLRMSVWLWWRGDHAFYPDCNCPLVGDWLQPIQLTADIEMRVGSSLVHSMSVLCTAPFLLRRSSSVLVLRVFEVRLDLLLWVPGLKQDVAFSGASPGSGRLGFYLRTNIPT